ncbi:ankyrin repeat domain-containing protein [Zavarzinella formosa]|uniref:ankyrin repeat domain-containing protein n=1 Tax=Zavarzinella formosa TaxID=360055 RepID=UPI00030B1FD8|nr:ankyrin repeat domain-containing protein [Zavarzinella formosa]
MGHGQELVAGNVEAETLAGRILADLDAPPDLPCPLLFSAVEHGRIEEVRRLIADGEDVNCDLGGGWTPLVHAIDLESDAAWQRHHKPDRESTELTELLLAAGAAPTGEAFAVARRYRNQRAVALLERHLKPAEQDVAPDCGGIE